MPQRILHINFSVIFRLILPFFKVFGLWWSWMKFFRHGPDTKVVPLIHISKCGKFKPNRRTLMFLPRPRFRRPGRGGMSRKSPKPSFFIFLDLVELKNAKKRIWPKNTPNCTWSFKCLEFM